MEQRKLTEGELRLMAFYHQLAALSPDTNVAGRLLILRPDGSCFANLSLSDRDLEAATDAIASLNSAKRALENDTRPVAIDVEEHFAQALAIVNGPGLLPEPTTGDVDDVVAGFEALLRGEGGQTA